MAAAISLLFFSFIITWLLPFDAELGEPHEGRLRSRLLQDFTVQWS